MNDIFKKLALKISQATKQKRKDTAAKNRKIKKALEKQRNDEVFYFRQLLAKRDEGKDEPSDMQIAFLEVLNKQAAKDQEEVDEL